MGELIQSLLEKDLIKGITRLCGGFQNFCNNLQGHPLSVEGSDFLTDRYVPQVGQGKQKINVRTDPESAFSRELKQGAYGWIGKQTRLNDIGSCNTKKLKIGLKISVIH